MDTDKPISRPEICTIDVAFPVTSDDEALKIKALISEALKDLPQKRIRFTITQG